MITAALTIAAGLFLLWLAWHALVFLVCAGCAFSEWLLLAFGTLIGAAAYLLNVLSNIIKK